MTASGWTGPQRDAHHPSVPDPWEHGEGRASGVQPPEKTLKTMSIVGDFSVCDATTCGIPVGPSDGTRGI